MGIVEIMSAWHSIVIKVDGLWAAEKHAPAIFDGVYFFWMLMRRQGLFLQRLDAIGSTDAFEHITPEALAAPGGFEAAFLRFATLLEELGVQRWAEEQDLICLLLDDCNIVVADGNHKVKWPCCKFDDVRYVEIPDVAQIPFGCEGNRLSQSDICTLHLKYVGRRTPREDDAETEAREVKDYCRADGLAAAITRRAARRKTRSEQSEAAEAIAAQMTSQAGASATDSVVASSVVASSGIASSVVAALASSGTAAASAASQKALRTRRRGAALTRSLGADLDSDVDELDTVEAEASGPSAKKPRSSYAKVDAAINKLVAARTKRSAAVAKLDEHRSLAEQVKLLKKKKEQVEQQKPEMDDDERFGVEFPHLDEQQNLYLESGTKAWHGMGDNAYIVEKIVGKESRGLVDYHAVKFHGWTRPSWEPSHAKLQQWHVEAYEKAVELGETEATIYPMDLALAPNPNLPQHVVTMPMTQFASSLATSECGVLKIEQVGEPFAGYLNTTAGAIMVSTACRRILFMMPMRNSETTTQTLWIMMMLKKRAPRWAERLKGFASDMACKVKLHVNAKLNAKLRDLPHDSPARPYYEWLGELAMFVDNFHFGNHSEADTFCRKTTNPDLYPELSTNTNSEVCEQIFRWWSRFKLMINHFNNCKATYFMQEMKELHNERSLRADVMSVKFMPAARLAEVRAAYALPSVPDTSASREGLAEFLLSQNSRPASMQRYWSQALLDAHRQKVGGKWRSVHAVQKRGAGGSAAAAGGSAAE